MKRYLILVLALIFITSSPLSGEDIPYPDLTLTGPLPLEEEGIEPEPESEDIIIEVNPKTVDHLITALNEKDPAVRSEAAWALGDIGREGDSISEDLNGKIIVSLMSALKDPNAEVRATGVRALAKIGLDKVIPAITNSLKDEDIRVRQEAARALLKLKPKNGVRMLIESINDRDPLVKKYAILSLGAIGAEEAVEPLKNILSSNDSYLKTEAIFALTRINKKEAIPFIISGFSDPYPLTRGEACSSLLYLEAYEHKYHLLKALKDNHFYVRRLAIKAMGGLNFKTESAVQQLVMRLNDEDASVRLETCRSLAQIKAGEAIESLAKSLADADPFVRHEAAKAMADIGGPATDILVNALDSKDIFSHCSAALALGYIGDKVSVGKAIPAKRGVESLETSLRDKDVYLRRNSAWALGKIREAGSLDGLLNALSDNDIEVRRNSAWALGEIKDKKAIARLVEHLSDEARVIRAESCRALGKIADNTALEPLLKALARVKDEHPSVRRESAWALGEIRDSRAVPLLIRSVTERTIPTECGPGYDDTRVRYEATLALGKIGSREAIELLEKCLTSEKETPPLVLRRALAEVLTNLSGKRYTYKKDYRQKTYFIK